MWLTPKLILIATFGTFLGIGGTMTPPIVFTIMTTYGLVQFYLQLLPSTISLVIECLNSLRRIQGFLLAEEINQTCITHNEYENNEPNAV